MDNKENKYIATLVEEKEAEVEKQIINHETDYIHNNDSSEAKEHPSVKFLRIYGGNNGLAHSNNHAHHCGYIYNNFPHRSHQEVMMHQALYEMNQKIAKERGAEYTFFYMPLPVAECLNKKRVEFDFYVVINGYSFGIEVDGDSHNQKSHFDEEERLKFIKLNGIDIYRVKPKEQNENWANDWLNSIFKIIERKRGRI